MSPRKFGCQKWHSIKKMEKRCARNATKSSWKFLIRKVACPTIAKADFNTTRKINFSIRVVPSLEASSVILQEGIGDRKLEDATHLVLSKNIIADVSSTKKPSTAVVSTDATNYHDRVADLHPSLCSRQFLPNLSYLLVIFRTTQDMKTHMRTTFGVSTMFCISDAQYFQGAFQGNRAFPELWIITSIF